jgi:hypothetical protein
MNFFEYENKQLTLLVNLYNIDGIQPTFAVRLYVDNTKSEWILITSDKTTYYRTYEEAKEALQKHIGFLTDIWSY